MIFKFDSYRSFLIDYISKLPKKGYGEAKKIAEHLSVSSTYISQIFQGLKDLNLEQADTLADYLGLQNLERDYFFFLVEKERAGTKKLKAYWIERLEQLKKQSLTVAKRINPNRTLTDEEKSVFYSSALYSAIHLFTSTHKNGRTIDQVKDRFEISRSKAIHILNFLCKIGLCKSEDGFFQMTENHTHVNKGSPHLLKHHSNWRIKAIQYAEELSEEELMYTANVSLSKNDFNKMREEMVLFIKSFIASAQASEAEEIATFHMDFIWIKK